MPRNQPVRHHTLGSNRLDRSPWSQQDFGEVPAARSVPSIDETSSRRGLGRTHPTHACLPVHKGFKSTPSACGSQIDRKSAASSVRYGNAIGVLQVGGTQ